MRELISNILGRLFRLAKAEKVQQLTADIKKNKYRPGLFKNFDWVLYLLAMSISLFGLVAIFAATAKANDTEVTGIINIIRANSIYYPGLQFRWILVGNAAFFCISLLDYHLYGKYSRLLYIANIIVLLSVLTVKAGRGGMTAFFNVSTSNLGERGFQPSELGKVIIIIALAKLFSDRKTPIHNIHELWPTLVYLGVPMFLVFIQPDFGTGLVYGVIYVVMVYISGTKRNIIWGVIAITVVIMIPAWYYFNTTSDDFRLTRILMWLKPSQYADEARQVINGQIAIGSGGLTGKGVVSVGSFASLGYIPDDHTDFCFAIVCEAFGFVGAGALVLAFILFLARLIYNALKIQDTFGEYIVVGAAAMFMFHILENICMILGILPVTGIPLPFISYGGSNYLTNMATLGLVMNVVMRSKEKRLAGETHYSGKL